MKHKITFTVFAVVLFFSSCSKASWEGAGYGAAPAAYKEMSVSYDQMEMAAEEAGDFEAAAAKDPEQSRKLTRRAYLRLRVEDQAVTEKQLSQLMEKFSAWPESSEADDYSFNCRIRVPSVLYDNLLAELAGLGRVLRRTENAEDVTLRYYDLESRLATKLDLLKTYRGYLAKARNIEEIMTVESKIAELQREIDQTGSQFRNLVNLVDYAVINLEVYSPVSTVSQPEATLGNKMAELFGSFGKVVSTTLVVLTGIIVYGIPAVLLVILCYWLLFGRIGLLRKLISKVRVKR